jgi:hypothetical protein
VATREVDAGFRGLAVFGGSEVWLSSRLGLSRSTCYAVLRRQGLHRLDWLDRDGSRGAPVRARTSP